MRQQIEDMELTDVDEDILDELHEGARTQGFLVDATGYPRHKVHERLKLLAASGAVTRIHESTALYELREDPRQDGDTE